MLEARDSIGVSGRDVEKQMTRRVGERMDGRGKEGRGSCLGWALACGREGRGWSELDGYVLMMPSVGNPGLLTDQRDHAAVDISHMANCSPYPPKPPPPPSKTPAAATPSTIGHLACTCTLVASTHPQSAAVSAPWEGGAWPHDAVAAAGRLHDAVRTLGCDGDVSDLHIVDQA